MARIDHYRLDLDTNDGGETMCFDKESAALAAFRKHSRRKAVTNAQLSAHEDDGEFIKVIAECDNVRPVDDRHAQAMGWAERY